MSDLELRAFIRQKQRSELQSKLIIIVVGFTIQIVFTLISLLVVPLSQRTGAGSSWMFLSAFPVGWLNFVFLLPIFLKRWIGFFLDSMVGQYYVARGIVTKCKLMTAGKEGIVSPMQRIKIEGCKHGFYMPIEKWNKISEGKEYECYYLKHSKVIYKLNGKTIWKFKK